MLRIGQRLGAEQPVKWVFYGNRITEGARNTFGWRIMWRGSRAGAAESNRRRDVAINTAISGNSLRDLLTDFDWWGQFAPQVVFVMVGMNDASPERAVAPADFRLNVTGLGERIQKLGALPVLQTTCLPLPQDSYPPRTGNLLALMDVLREVAAAEKLPLVDHTRHWQAAIQESPQRAHAWMTNICHPNQFGHRAFAELLFRELGVFDTQSLVCRQFIP